MTIHMELFLACDLRDDVPEQVIDTLKYLTRKEDYEFNNPPDYPFFGKTSWHNIFQKSDFFTLTEISNFPGAGFILFDPNSWDSEFYKLTIRCEIDSHHEFVEMYFPFLEWLALYADTEALGKEVGEFAGYLRRTNIGTGRPTLIYFRDEKVHFSEVEENLVEITAENIDQFV